MKTAKRILLALLILVVIVLIGAVVFIRHLATRAMPDYNKQLSLTGLHAPVEVYRDSMAIPHVYAKDEHDLYMAVGYLLAEDRLWQMDLLRRVTEGRLSEIFGEDYIDTDLLLRALRFSEKSDKILAATTPETHVALDAFADGINQYIARNRRRLPPEFAILGYAPESWQPRQSLNMIGYMAWDLKAGWSEIILREISAKVDSARYAQLIPSLSGSRSVVYGGYRSTTKATGALPELLLNNRNLADLGADVLEGSNNWAVSGKKSATGMPILANDMHLGLNIPGIWYQMHQVVEGSLNVTGLVLPGAPVVVCGHNDSIAWGMTNTYVDNLDFYEETVNPDNPDQYKTNGVWQNFEVRREVINIKGGEIAERTLRFTQHGAVVSGFKKITDKVVSMHWVGDEVSDELRTILMLNHANNWDQFREALKTFTSISQNVVYADRKGNIGLYCAAGVPIRNRDIAFGILPGDTNAYDWKGYVPFEALPNLFNPEKGYVSSANNRTATDEYPYHIGTWYSLPSRFDRINEMLEAKPVLSLADFKAMQLDQHSRLAQKYMPALLTALESANDLNEPEKVALGILQQWDFNMAAKEPGPAIFETLYLQLMKSIFSDETGELYTNFSGASSVSRIGLDQLMETGNSPWFDNIATKDKTETLNDDIVAAFKTSVAELQKSSGTDPAAWQWGNIHHLVLAHSLASVKILDRLFSLNRGPFPVGGSFHTVSPYSYDATEPFDADHGSSHRHIYDVADWDRSLTIIPTGNSGIPASRHYCDQTELYVSGKYHADYFSRDKVLANARYHMQFIP